VPFSLSFFPSIASQPRCQAIQGRAREFPNGKSLPIVVVIGANADDLRLVFAGSATWTQAIETSPEKSLELELRKPI
jgi:uncharacterized protein YcgI (DUF1989 family)